MKAAVFHGTRDITIEDIPEPKVEPNGVVIKVKACGICGSDLHLYKRGGRQGIILGHEFSGDTVEIGANVMGVGRGAVSRWSDGAPLCCGYQYMGDGRERAGLFEVIL